MMRRLCFLIALLPLPLHAEGMTEVTYMDQEPNAGGLVTRYLVTDRFLRMDYGRDRDDYVLYDRKTKRVYNVTHANRQVLIFDPDVVEVDKPREWELRDDIVDDRTAQKRVNIIVNGKICTRIVATETFLPDVARAMGEFGVTMAATHARTYNNSPPDFREACDLARLILSPRHWFKYGLPIDELHYTGFSRRLLNYQAAVMERPTLFAIPEPYQKIEMRKFQQ